MRRPSPTAGSAGGLQLRQSPEQRASIDSRSALQEGLEDSPGPGPGSLGAKAAQGPPLASMLLGVAGDATTSLLAASSSGSSDRGRMLRNGYSAGTLGAQGGKGQASGGGGYPVRPWHVLFVLGLGVQLYIFHRFEANMGCLHSRDGGMHLVGAASEGVGHRQTLRSGGGALSDASAMADGGLGAAGAGGGRGGLSVQGFSVENAALFQSITPALTAPPQFNSCQLANVGGRASDNYGAWVLCQDLLRPRSTIYSFGIGLDISFDNALTLQGHRVYGFDPTVTPDSVRGMFLTNHGRAQQPPEFQFRQLGLSAEDGVLAFHRSSNARVQSQTAVSLSLVKANYRRDQELLSPVLRLGTFMCALRHATLDVLKMDVEGVEFSVCLSPAFRALLPRVAQVLIEFHERMIKGGADDKAACFRVLQEEGFRVAHISQNKQEISFARLAPGAPILPPQPLGAAQTA